MLRRLSWILSVIVLCAFWGPPITVAAVGNPASPGTTPSNPIGFGQRDLNAAIRTTANWPKTLKIDAITVDQASSAAAKAAAKVLPAKAESFAIARSGNTVAIVGRDQVGTMYGCFELAERLGLHGTAALNISKPIVQSPVVEFRAINPFLCLPYKETDKDWWFLRDDFWTPYLDLLARSRINWIDLHGMYDTKSTGFPNIYPYFITSQQFPEVGVDPATAQRNLAMLNKVIAMAKARGIKFSLMSYSTSWSGQGMRKVPYERTKENLPVYTQEVVRQMIKSCPDLAMIGFRIGESGNSETFYKNSYIPAIKDSGRQIDLYTRTWGAKKDAIISLGNEFPGRFLIEPKYNGEQFGPSYVVAGGRATKSHDYFYQSYFNYPKNYRVIFQLRASGSSRVFTWGSPILAARANKCSVDLGAIGLCVEPIEAYNPKYDYIHKDDSPNKWYQWQYQHNWFWYQVWGRTGYDPSLGNRDDVWVRMFAKKFGKAGKDMYEAMAQASNIVPDSVSSISLGWDQRNQAPELETGGPLKDWVTRQPMDTANVETPKEYADNLVNHTPSAKLTPFDMARSISDAVSSTEKHLIAAKAEMTKPTAEFNDLVTELTALDYLGKYYAYKLRAATLLAVMNATSDLSLEPQIRSQLTNALNAWNRLAALADRNYKPFVDTLRMHTEHFTWTKEGMKLDGDIDDLDAAVTTIKASGKTGHAALLPTHPGPKIENVKVVVAPEGQNKKLKITASVVSQHGNQSVFLRIKPFPSDIDYTKTPMTKVGNVYVAEVTATPDGLIWGIEAVDKDGCGAIWPDLRRETPYKIVFPWNAQK